MSTARLWESRLPPATRLAPAALQAGSARCRLSCLAVAVPRCRGRDAVLALPCCIARPAATPSLARRAHADASSRTQGRGAFVWHSERRLGRADGSCLWMHRASRRLSTVKGPRDLKRLSRTALAAARHPMPCIRPVKGQVQSHTSTNTRTRAHEHTHTSTHAPVSRQDRGHARTSRARAADGRMDRWTAGPTRSRIAPHARSRVRLGGYGIGWSCFRIARSGRSVSVVGQDSEPRRSIGSARQPSAPAAAADQSPERQWRRIHGDRSACCLSLARADALLLRDIAGASAAPHRRGGAGCARLSLCPLAGLRLLLRPQRCVGDSLALIRAVSPLVAAAMYSPSVHSIASSGDAVALEARSRRLPSKRTRPRRLVALRADSRYSCLLFARACEPAHARSRSGISRRDALRSRRSLPAPECDRALCPLLSRPTSTRRGTLTALEPR